MEATTISLIFNEIVSQLSKSGIPYKANSTESVPATEAMPAGFSVKLEGSLDRQLEITATDVEKKLIFVISIRNNISGQVVYIRHLFKKLQEPISFDDFKFDSLTAEKNIAGIAKKLVDVLTKNQKIAEIIRGHEWIDVSFDWAGMR